MKVHAAAMILAWAALSAGRAPPQPRCSNATLTGQYIFAGQGIIEPIEPGVERVHYGLFVFDGRGNLRGKQSSSRGGRIGREQLAGSYRLEPDCSGNLSFRHVDQPGKQTYGPGIETHWDLYVTNDGRTGHIIRMDDGTMAVRTFQK